MDNEKHERISSPKGPEDASNIADEYPSPERTPATLSEHVPTKEVEQPSATQEISTQDETEADHADLHAELNQVAAQAIEAAVAAEVRAANAKVNDPVNNDTSVEVLSNGNTNGDIEMNNQNNSPTEGESSIQANQTHQHHLRNHPHQHNPRQPNFASSSSILGKRYHTSSGSPSSSSHHQHLLSQFANKPKSVVPKLSQNEQVVILREAYAKNPNPGKKELELLAEKTGRPWNKIREYFRQRRNKLRGLEDLEGMEEPGRASGWLQVAYRQAPSTSSVSQLSLYNSYKHRFDPYSITTPLLGGQELIQLACATFPGCEMAKDESEYVLKGLKEKEKEQEGENGNEGDAEEWEKGMEGLVEPLRAGSWLLSSFQHQNDPNAPSTLTQTDLYTSYAARFSSLLTNAGQSDSVQNQSVEESTQQEQDHDADMRAFEDAGLNNDQQENDQSPRHLQQHQQHQQQQQQIENENVNEHQSLASLLPSSSSNTNSGTNTNIEQIPSIKKKENRLLNPYELINLTRMTFPKCEPIIDENGKFVIKGLEKRIGHLPGSAERNREMFNFTLYNENKPGEAFVNLMKRKLGLLNSESSFINEEINNNNSKKLKINLNEENHEKEENNNNNNLQQQQQEEKEEEEEEEENLFLEKLKNEKELDEQDKELINGLKRFRNSKLGESVREVCISQ
ncbi:uncharacterized protein I206_101531 [Kwoniella pini CBS 10737]|uniref:Homeobox domain-containing protein n=1 Tax=Kwoniella pini CBS 10737 TaxID=1296096 RepID=A0A1B9HWE7_9TREE|nr:uncharacterized protein I206_06497 [Kwoniella pini CBS 10737]OCF47594.1 hypothetical protein I206_06497 [Kwoniella pini CBS 10737]